MSCNQNSQFSSGRYILHSLQLINMIVSCKTIPGYLSSQRLFLGKTKASQLSLESTSLASSIQYLYFEQRVPLAPMNKACALPGKGWLLRAGPAAAAPGTRQGCRDVLQRLPQQVRLREG